MPSIRIATLLAAVLSAGCASLDLKNHLAPSIDGKAAYVLSMWGPLGIASRLSEESASELRRLREAAAKAVP